EVLKIAGTPLQRCFEEASNIIPDFGKNLADGATDAVALADQSDLESAVVEKVEIPAPAQEHRKARVEHHLQVGEEVGVPVCHVPERRHGPRKGADDVAVPARGAKRAGAATIRASFSL